MSRVSKAAAAVSLLMGASLLLAGCATPATAPTPAPSTTPTTSTAATSDPSLQKIKDKGVLVVGTAPFYAPFESTDSTTKAIVGFDVDMVNAITAKMGITAKFVGADWQALLGGLGKGDYDVIVSCMSKKEAASGNVSFSDVYYNLPDVIIVKKGNPAGLTDKSSLAGKAIGVQLGSGSEQLADSLNKDLGFGKLKKYKLTQDAMNDLKAGRIDAVIAGLAFAVEQNKVDSSFQIVGDPLATAEIVAVFPKGADSLTAEFNKGLAAIKADGTYDGLIQKWLTLK